MKTNRIGSWLAGATGFLAAVVVFGLVIAGGGEPDRSLLDRATPVASTKGWFWQPFLSYPDYAWLSDHEVLYAQQTLDGYRHLVRLDLRTGSALPVKALDPITYGSLLNVSPDGNWLLWMPQNEAGSWYAVTSSDGSRSFRRLPNAYNDNLAWLPGNRKWATVAGTGAQLNLDVSSIDDTTINHVTTDIPSEGARSLLGFSSIGQAVLCPESKFYVGSYRRVKTLPLTLLDIRHSPAASQTINVPVPAQPDAQDGAIRLSPDGSRLLWSEVAFPNIPPQILGFLLKLPIPIQSIVHLQTGRRLNVWISRLDGSGLRNVGVLQEERGREFGTDIKWTPDGKHISFIHGGRLYTMLV